MAVGQNQTKDLGAFRKTYLPRVAPGRAMLGVAIFCVLFFSEYPVACYEGSEH